MKRFTSFIALIITAMVLAGCCCNTNSCCCEKRPCCPSTCCDTKPHCCPKPHFWRDYPCDPSNYPLEAVGLGPENRECCP